MVREPRTKAWVWGRSCVTNQGVGVGFESKPWLVAHEPTGCNKPLAMVNCIACGLCFVRHEPRRGTFWWTWCLSKKELSSIAFRLPNLHKNFCLQIFFSLFQMKILLHLLLLHLPVNLDFLQLFHIPLF
jgi:hypothetical protein